MILSPWEVILDEPIGTNSNINVQFVISVDKEVPAAFVSVKYTVFEFVELNVFIIETLMIFWEGRAKVFGLFCPCQHERVFDEEVVNCKSREINPKFMELLAVFES